MPRKLSAIRQFSLQCDAPPAPRRASLKKQHSEELLDDDAGIRISLSAKAAHRTPKTPKHPIKIAWGDEEGERPARPFRRHSYIAGGDDGFAAGGKCGGQDLAQKLHLAWQERENSKNKLNIFLAHSFSAQQQDDCGEHAPKTQPKITQALLLQQDNSIPSYNANSGGNIKQMFQKHLRKSKAINSPVGSDFEAAAAVERTKERSVNSKDQRDNQKSLNPRPQTASSAAQKRAMFQKRTNSAFTSLNSNSACPSPLPPPTNPPSRQQLRPPMVRASSLPTSKPDFQVKTRLRRKIKLAKRTKHPGGKDNDDERKNSDVVTMVSLVSPSESEEEPEAAPKEIASAKDDAKGQASPRKTSPHSPKKQTGVEKHFSLRKTVKQVSFQHSSIHAVRSFSASFPARRASVGAALLVESAAKKLQKSLEKRGQPDEGLAEAKRRLLQPENASAEKAGPDAEVDTQKTPLPSSREAGDKGGEDEGSSQPRQGQGQPNEDHCDGVESVKERKCWETYCRMTKSGLNVSFDTILRGMLTPTEYRLRRRLSLQQTHEEDVNDVDSVDKPDANEE